MRGERGEGRGERGEGRLRVYYFINFDFLNILRRVLREQLNKPASKL